MSELKATLGKIELSVQDIEEVIEGRDNNEIKRKDKKNTSITYKLISP